jgi:predicted dehydrogenase
VLGASPALMESNIAIDGTGTFSLDFGGLPCTFELANETTGPWREGIQIGFERGAVTIELPPPFAGEEARISIDESGRRSELPREMSWAFRRQAEAFVSDIIGQARSLASGEDSVTDIALAEAIWRRRVDASTR